MTAELTADQAIRQVVQTARDMLNGTVSFIEGARRINRLRWSAGVDQFDPDFLPFVGIDSETDALPLGEVRRHWAPDALVKLQLDIDRAQKWAENYGRDYCQRLIDRFQSRSEPNA